MYIKEVNKMIKQLKNKFWIYCNDDSYYKSLLNAQIKETPIEELYKTVKKIMINEINVKWQEFECEWFVNYLNQKILVKKDCLENLELFKEILNSLNNLYLNISFDHLVYLLDKCPKFNELLLALINSLHSVTEQNIEKLSDNKDIVDLLYTYASLKDLLVEETEIDLVGSYDESQMPTSLVNIYLREAGRYPLLKPDEEKGIAKKAFEGDKEAKSKLAEHNLRLVVNIAKRYMGRGLDIEDLIQAGNEGLLKAVEKYDYRKGYRFSTYSTWWIKQSIGRTINNEGRTVRIPVHSYTSYRKISKVKEELENDLGYKPSVDQIAEKAGIKKEKVTELMQDHLPLTSLDAQVGDSDSNELGYFIKDENIIDPEEYAINSFLKDSINEVLSTLTAREEKVIRMRFGIQKPGENNPLYSGKHTLEEVGKELQRTKERIRQIEDIALKKLRHPKRAKRIESYRDDDKIGEGRMKKTFLDYFPQEQWEVVKQTVSCLPKIDQDAIYARYGLQLNDYFEEVNYQKIARANRQISIVREMIANPNYNHQINQNNAPIPESKNDPLITHKLQPTKDKKIKMFLKNWLDCNESIIVGYRDSLADGSERKILMTKAYGEDLLGEYNSSALSLKEKARLNTYITTVLKPKADLFKIFEKKTLREYLECTPEEFATIKEMFSKDHYYNSATLLWGKDLDDEINLTEYFKINRNSFNAIIRRLKALLENSQKVETKPKQQETTEEVSPVTGGILEAKSEEVELLAPKEYETIQTQFNYPLFKEAINIVPIEYRYVTALYLGIYDGLAHSSQALAEIFNVDEEIVLHKIDMGIAFFKEIVASYERIYGQEFPQNELDAHDGPMLLRNKNV